jgi:DNA polymerase
VISLDYETRSELDLRKVGLDRYTSHPSFAVLMAAYRIDDGPLCHWEAHKEPLPQEVRERLLDPTEKNGRLTRSSNGM